MPFAGRSVQSPQVPSEPRRESQVSLRVGSGHDTHRLAEGRPLVLGGVRIDHPKGLVGHSDADRLCPAEEFGRKNGG